MKRTILCVAVMGLLCSPVLADQKVLNTSIQAFDDGLVGITRATPYGTGFEPGERFAPGYVGGQAGWTAFTASVTEGHVDTVNPYSGVQHLRISHDPTLAGGTYTGGFSPNLGLQNNDPVSVSIMVAISATGGADYDVVPQTPTQGYQTARVNFSYLGDIRVLDDLGGGTTWVDTGANWVPGAYKNLTIDIDPGADTIDYSYGGASIYSGVAGVFLGTCVEEVVLWSDNWHAGDCGDFDDLTITPEPATLGLLAIGALGMLRRRR